MSSSVGTFRLEPLGPQHNEPDFAAWTSSAGHIHSTPGWVGHDWPDLSMTLQDNMGDLVRHARDFEERQGFTYTVEEAGSGETIGCVYIYPPKAAAEGDARVKSWVRADRASLDPVLYRAVRDWLVSGLAVQQLPVRRALTGAAPGAAPASAAGRGYRCLALGGSTPGPETSSCCWTTGPVSLIGWPGC